MDPLRPPPSSRLPMFRRRDQFNPQPDTPPPDPPNNTMEPTPWSPSYADVRATRIMLEDFKIPTELVLDILDRARYWPSRNLIGRNTKAESNAKVCLYGSVWSDDIVQGLGGEEENLKLREIEFDILSRDQGWTSEGTEGTYNTSSWLEISIMRRRPDYSGPSIAISPNDIIPIVEADIEKIAFWHSGDLRHLIEHRGWTFVERPSSAQRYPQEGEENIAWYLQGNRVATEVSELSKVLWATDKWVGNEGSGKGEGFLEELKKGDLILIWARAKFPGWVCDVESIRMTVRFGV